MPIIITQEKILNDFKLVHGDKFDYSLVKYKGTHDKIEIICKIHGVFYQTPSKHKSGQKCPKCRGLNKTTQDIIKEFKLVHGETYDYSYVNYTKCNVKIDIKCKLHGIFHQSATDHLNKNGCPKCGSINRSINNKINTNKRRNWEFSQPEEYKLIPLTKGKLAKVDNEDFERLKDINWYATKQGYAGIKKIGLMHRFIMNPPEGMVIDHINHDTLDNRKSNLRICTQKENSKNTRSDETRWTSKYKGVSYSKAYNKWICQIISDKKIKHRSKHLDEIEAAKEYDKKAKELFGEFAYLNFR